MIFNKFREYGNSTYILFFIANITTLSMFFNQGDIYTYRYEIATNKNIKYAKKHVDDTVLSYRKKLEETPCGSYTRNTTVNVSFCEKGYCCDLNPLEKCTKTNHIYNETVFDIYTFAHCKEPYTDIEEQSLLLESIWIGLIILLQFGTLCILVVIPVPSDIRFFTRQYIDFRNSCILRVQLFAAASILTDVFAISNIEKAPDDNRVNYSYFFTMYIFFGILLSAEITKKGCDVRERSNTEEQELSNTQEQEQTGHEVTGRSQNGYQPIPEEAV